MPGIKSEFASNSDYLTPFEVYASGVSSSQTVNGVSQVIDVRDSISALNNIIAVVLTGATNATATVSVYVKPNSGSITDYVLLETKTNIPTNVLVEYKGLYAGAYKIVVTNLVSGPVDVHVSYSDLRGQYVLDDLS